MGAILARIIHQRHLPLLSRTEAYSVRHHERMGAIGKAKVALVNDALRFALELP